MKRLAVVLGLLVGACTPLGSDSTGEPRAVVWIEVDTLRADALGCYGNLERGEEGARTSPNLDALASEGVLFERAYSAAPWTVPSVVTQLTGLWPWQHGAVRLLQPLPTGVPSLPERFRSAGWRTAGVMTNYVAQAEFGFNRGFDLWDQSLAADGPEGSTGTAAAERLLAITDGLLERPGAGLFLLLYLFEPHWRYEPQPGLRFGPEGAGELTREGSLAELRARRGELTEAELADLRGTYLSEVAGVDRAIGVFLDGLRERDLLDEALVVFTSDHGEELMERGWIGHTRTLFDELVRVPLVMRLPASLDRARAARRISAPVSLIDLGATILDLVGLDATLGEGISLAATVERGEQPARRYLYLHTDFDPPLLSPENREKVARLWGVVDAETNEKWIVDRNPEHERDGQPPVAWYHLHEDPREERDLSESHEVPARFFSLEALDPNILTSELTHAELESWRSGDE